MKKILSIIIVLLTLNLGNAFSEEDPSKEILDAMSEKAESYESIKLEFVYSLQNKKYDLNENRSGLIILKGDKYVISTTIQEVYCDGKKTWTYIKGEKKVAVTDVSIENEPKGDIIDPRTMINLYKMGFDYELLGEKVQNGIATQEIKLTPQEGSGRSYQQILLWIDKQKKEPTKVILQWEDGTTYTYTINAFTPNVKIDDSKFVFNKPGIEPVNF